MATTLRLARNAGYARHAASGGGDYTIHFCPPTRDGLEDQTRATVEGQIGPQPVQRDLQAVAEPDQEPDVGGAPQEPGRKASELEPCELHRRGLAAHGGEASGVGIAE